MGEIGDVNDRFHEDFYQGRENQHGDVVLRERSIGGSGSAGMLSVNVCNTIKPFEATVKS